MKKLISGWLVMVLIVFCVVRPLPGNAESCEVLLGDSNGFTVFSSALEADANSYIEAVKDMVFVVGDAFNSAQLGTKRAQAAIKAIIPESVYADAKDADAKMGAIYKYFTTGKIARYFTIEFYDDGELYDVYIPLENVKRFVQDGIDSKVFTGSFDAYELNPKVTQLDDFCSKMNITKEVAVAMLQLMENYDISWLDGDQDTLLDDFLH